MFNQKGNGYIASALGLPLYMDKVTATKERLAFARICIEIDAMKVIPKTIELVLPNKVVHVQVEVPWLPLKCSKCRVFGHADRNCNKNVTIDRKFQKEVKGWVFRNKKPEGMKKNGKTLVVIKNAASSSAGVVKNATVSKNASSSFGIVASVNKFETLQNTVVVLDGMDIVVSPDVAIEMGSPVISTMVQVGMDTNNLFLLLVRLLRKGRCHSVVFPISMLVLSLCKRK